MNCIESYQLAITRLRPGWYLLRVRGLEGAEWSWGASRWVPVGPGHPNLVKLDLEHD
jgi:hypothetical protein